MSPMTDTADARERLGTLVARRRAELRLMVKPAARAAGINNATWKKVEDGLPVRDVTYAAVESALRWELGSCQAVLKGGDPRPVDDTPPEEPAPELVEHTADFDIWEPAVRNDDLRDAVRGAALATLPGVTGAQVQEFERRLEEELARRLARRTHKAN